MTTVGSLESKRLATDPRWARVLVAQLTAHGVGPGSIITASFSGSFPGLNLAVMAACRAMQVRLIAVSSVTASTWGAVEPGFTWPEMEVLVVRAGVLPAATVAVSVGGSSDAGRDLSEEGRAIARRIQQDTAAGHREVLIVRGSSQPLRHNVPLVRVRKVRVHQRPGTGGVFCAGVSADHNGLAVVPPDSDARSGHRG